MSYSPYYTGGWQTGETGGTPITPAALNHMDSGIGANAAAAAEQAEDISDVNALLGNTSMGTTATTVTGAIKEHSNKIGNTSMGTTAQTLTGAIAEHESDISALNGKLEYGSFTTFSTFTPISCTGTVSGSLYFKTSSSRWVYFSGRINIANYARTGGNPGVSFTLPTGIPTPTETTNIPVGINSLFPREQVNIRLTAGSRTAQFTTTESFSNSTGNVLTFMFTPVFFYVP